MIYVTYVTLTVNVFFVTFCVKMKPHSKQPDKREQSVALNIRDFPADLRWACNAKASLTRKDLREFVIECLQAATNDIKLA